MREIKAMTEEITEITTRSSLSSAETAGALNNSIGSGNFYLTIVMYFVVVTLIIVGFIYLRKYLLKRIGGIKNGSSMKIKDRLIIAQDKQIILLEVKNKILMIGISGQSMSALGEFEKDEIFDDNADDDGQKSIAEMVGSNRKDGTFLSILSEKIKTGFDNFDKNKKD